MSAGLPLQPRGFVNDSEPAPVEGIDSDVGVEDRAPFEGQTAPMTHLDGDGVSDTGAPDDTDEPSAPEGSTPDEPGA
jgi:hypothetical protein